VYLFRTIVVISRHLCDQIFVNEAKLSASSSKKFAKLIDSQSAGWMYIYGVVSACTSCTQTTVAVVAPATLLEGFSDFNKYAL